MIRISYARRRAAFLRLAALGSVMLASLATAVPVLRYASQELYVSGFSGYLSLVFSDISAASLYWRELGLSLVESLPSIAILMVVGVSVVLFWCLRRAVRDSRIVLGLTAA